MSGVQLGGMMSPLLSTGYSRACACSSMDRAAASGAVCGGSIPLRRAKYKLWYEGCLQEQSLLDALYLTAKRTISVIASYPKFLRLV